MTVSYSRVLKLKSPQMYGEDVKEVQKKLNYLGYNSGNIDGYFGKNTDRAVKKYQKASKLVVDGLVGPNTWKKLIEGPNIKNVTELLLSLFIKYEYKYKSYWSKMSVPGQLYVFYNLVRNGGEADLKNHGFKESNYIFDDKVVKGDAPGNILYGYVGKAFEFSDELLLRAAGFAQQKAGTSNPEWGKWNGNPPYGDDPNDQNSIKIGIDFFKRVHD